MTEACCAYVPLSGFSPRAGSYYVRRSSPPEVEIWHSEVAAYATYMAEGARF